MHAIEMREGNWMHNDQTVFTPCCSAMHISFARSGQDAHVLGHLMTSRTSMMSTCQAVVLDLCWLGLRQVSQISKRGCKTIQLNALAPNLPNNSQGQTLFVYGALQTLCEGFGPKPPKSSATVIYKVPQILPTLIY